MKYTSGSESNFYTEPYKASALPENESSSAETHDVLSQDSSDLPSNPALFSGKRKIESKRAHWSPSKDLLLMGL